MTRDAVYNFSSGPSMMPTEVLERAGAEITNFAGSGMSVMEMSHRSAVYIDVFTGVKRKLRECMDIPDSHEILFLQGGATAQFSMVPLNLMSGGTADYAVTGNFSASAAREAEKYGCVNIAADTGGSGHTRIPVQTELRLTEAASYFYYCSNNTIYGTEWKYIPETPGAPLVCDMSSNILSKPVDVSKYGLIFAGAQKNMAPAGLTVVIIDRALAGREPSYTPLIMNYGQMIKSDSMYNTPPCYNIYLLGLMLDWIAETGGVGAMERLKREKAALLYDFIDNSALYRGCAGPEARSDMNITFRTKNPETDAAFASEAERSGLMNLKGHRSVGGLRASVYNAMPMEGVLALIEFMKRFEAEHV